jgi:hypothetical protein
MTPVFALLLMALAFAQPVPPQEVADFAERLRMPIIHPTVADDYHFLGELYGRFAAAAMDKPGAVEIEEIGRTVANRPIYAFHIHEPGTPVQREVLVFAGIHALEWIAVETASALLLELLALPPRGVRVTVIPVLNVDGRLSSEGDLIHRKNTYRRRNRNNVDLNRDFSINRDQEPVWIKVIPKRYSHSPAPLSQPESQALDALAARQRYDRAASLHAYGGYFFFPWSGSYRRPPDWDRFLTIGRAMEAAQRDHAYRPRQLGRWGFFFRARGSEIDHLYARYDTLAYLIELTRSGMEPLRIRETRATYFRWYNPVDPTKHVERGVSALRALIRTPVSGS